MNISLTLNKSMIQFKLIINNNIPRCQRLAHLPYIQAKDILNYSSKRTVWRLWHAVITTFTICLFLHAILLICELWNETDNFILYRCFMVCFFPPLFTFELSVPTPIACVLVCGTSCMHKYKYFGITLSRNLHLFFLRNFLLF